MFGTQQGDDTIGKIAVDYDSPFQSEVIGVDFVSGVDLIELQGFAISTGAEALALVSDVDGVATFASEGTTITFAGLTAADLTDENFTFG